MHGQRMMAGAVKRLCADYARTKDHVLQGGCCVVLLLLLLLSGLHAWA
jgi:hypothetical protein